jgi:thiosulfate/3-mercaptopyruvate sulfurtransferase
MDPGILLLLLTLAHPAPDLLIRPQEVGKSVVVDAGRLEIAPRCVSQGVACVQQALGRAGFDGTEKVVVAGEDGAAVGWAFWLLEWAGFQNVKVLDGRWPGKVRKRWRARRFVGKASESAAAGMDWVRGRMGEKGVEMLDLRDAGIWMETGYEAPPRYAAGHVPHALPFDFQRWSPKEGRWSTASGDAWETLKKLGPRPVTPVDPEAEFVLYGESPEDRRPVLGYLLLRLAGVPVRVFPGGFQEWSQEPANPVERIVDALEVQSLLAAEDPELRGERVARTVAVLDLRETWDWQAGHIPGSHCLPAYDPRISHEKSVAERWPEARSARMPVVLYCYGRGCIRSREVAVKLARAGFTNLLWFREGLEGWRAAGLPVVH